MVFEERERDLLTDKYDYPTTLPRHAIRSALFRSGLIGSLGSAYWQPTAAAPYIHKIQSRAVTMFGGIPTDFADPIYNAMIGADSNRWSPFEETITAIDDCWVEPNRCQILGPDGRLVQQSITHRLVPLFPSAWGYATRGKGVRIAEAIVYDGFYSHNYYHHLVDTLPSVSLFLERSQLNRDLPLVVNRWTFESRFFADLRTRSPTFARLNWLVQEPGEWLNVERAYRLHAVPFEKSVLMEVRSLYGRLSEPNGRRVFLSRDSKMFGRGIQNEHEVAMLLSNYGFETVYAEHLTLDEQQRIFEQTTHLVALQGMGLAQQLFMEASRGHVLEIMPRNRLQSEYYWQGWTLGMRYYDVLTGGDLASDGKYTVDADSIERSVQAMLAHPGGFFRYGNTLVTDESGAAE